jgi:hypothetical protein
MKTLKLLLLTPLLLSFALFSYAGTSGDTDSSEVENASEKQHTTNDDNDLRHVEFGVRYMPTFSSVDIHTSDGGTMNGTISMSQGFGIMTAVNLNKHIGVQAEVNYYQVSQKYSDQNSNQNLTINYLNIPVLLSLNTNKQAPVNLNIVAGPQFGLNVGSKFNTSGNNSGDSSRAVVALKKGDVGFAYGAGLEFALNKSHTFRLDLGYRGFFGLVDMDATSNDQGTYNVIVHASRKTYGGYAGLAWLF